MNKIITEKIIKTAFPSYFNDGRKKRGRVGIRKNGNGWDINTVQSYVCKHINTINELEEFLKKEGVPFDFKISKKQVK